MVRLHEWSAPSFNPTTRTLGRDDERPHDAEDDLRRGMTERSTSTRRNSKRDQLANVTVLVTPARALPCGRAQNYGVCMIKGTRRYMHALTARGTPNSGASSQRRIRALVTRSPVRAPESLVMRRSRHTLFGRMLEGRHS